MEGLQEHLSRAPVYLPYRFIELLPGIYQVLLLGGEELEALVLLFILFDGRKVDRPEAFELALLPVEHLLRYQSLFFSQRDLDSLEITAEVLLVEFLSAIYKIVHPCLHRREVHPQVVDLFEDRFALCLSLLEPALDTADQFALFLENIVHQTDLLLVRALLFEECLDARPLFHDRTLEPRCLFTGRADLNASLFYNRPELLLHLAQPTQLFVLPVERPLEGREPDLSRGKLGVEFLPILPEAGEFRFETLGIRDISRALLHRKCEPCFLEFRKRLDASVLQFVEGLHHHRGLLFPHYVLALDFLEGFTSPAELLACACGEPGDLLYPLPYRLLLAAQGSAFLLEAGEILLECAYLPCESLDLACPSEDRYLFSGRAGEVDAPAPCIEDTGSGHSADSVSAARRDEGDRILNRIEEVYPVEKLIYSSPRPVRRFDERCERAEHPGRLLRVPAGRVPARIIGEESRAAELSLGEFPCELYRPADAVDHYSIHQSAKHGFERPAVFFFCSDHIGNGTPDAGIALLEDVPRASGKSFEVFLHLCEEFVPALHRGE